MKSSQHWLILGCCLVTLICLGTAAFLAFTFLFTTPLSVGPTFTTPESLAYDAVYETAAADANSITHLQTQAAGNLHAVLMGYQVNGQSDVRLILARDNGREFFVENMASAFTAANLISELPLQP